MQPNWYSQDVLSVWRQKIRTNEVSQLYQADALGQEIGSGIWARNSVQEFGPGICAGQFVPGN
jgi:hypothetical protein